jgi:Zn-dependent protease
MRGWRLGRIAGIDIEIHFTWLLIFVLVLLSMTRMPLAGMAPGQPGYLHFIFGLAVTILFFASLVLHELAHSLVARHEGLPVRRITLFVFGGVSQLEEEPRSAADEFRMAIVGPLTSAILGLACLGIARLLRLPFASLPREIFWYIGVLNLMLAVFNMLPAFPLDGGRVFRSFLWWATRDLRRATHAAATLGKVFGYGLAGIGIWQVVAIHDLGGLWYLVLGWVLAGVAEQSYRRVQLTAVLQGLHVADFMASPAVTVPADMDLEQFAHTYEFMLRHGAYPVIADGKIVGMLHREVLRTTPRHAWPMTQVRQVMEPLDMAAMVIQADASLDLALTRMMESGRPRLMVMDMRSQLAGMISQADVLRAMQSTKS